MNKECSIGKYDNIETIIFEGDVKINNELIINGVLKYEKIEYEINELM